MKNKRIISVGFVIPGNFVEYVPFRSDQSLLDADIIVFEPNIREYILGYSEQYHGKPLLSEADSFGLYEDSSRWRSELKIALEDGKTVFIFLSELVEVFIYTG